MTSNSSKNMIYSTIIRVNMIIYIAAGVIIGFINGVISGSFSESGQHLIHQMFIFYEHEFRVITVLVCAFCTYQILVRSRKGISKYRTFVLLSLSASMIVFHLVLPALLNYRSITLLYLPFPWGTSAFQAAATGEILGDPFTPFGGAQAALITYGVFNLIFIGGTLLFGRRWHCTFLCTMNACHAETTGEVLPMVKPKSAIDPKQPPKHRALRILQVVLFVINLGFAALWILHLTIGFTPFGLPALVLIETLKYIILELFLMCWLWIFSGARGYCYYCPAGVTLGYAGRVAGQRIETDLTRCVSCGRCNEACKMSIDVMAHAEKGIPVKDLNCVGCGLCVEACPTNNLSYTTTFLSKIREAKKLSQEDLLPG